MYRFLFLLVFILQLDTHAQIRKSYVKYCTAGNYRNSEGDLLVKLDGSYYAVWTEFATSVADDSPTKLSSKISVDDGRNWINYKIEQENIGAQNIMSVSLVRISGATVHMYFVVKNSDTDLKVYRKISTDDCTTWGAPAVVIADPGYSIALNGKVRKTASGRLIIPIGWVADVGSSPVYYRSYCYYSDNNGASWTKSSPELIRNSGIGLVENGFVETSPDNLLMHMRESVTGFQWFSTSTDNGATWAAASQSTLSSTSSPAAMIKLTNGSLIAIHNYDTIPADATHNTRIVLRVSKSADNGASWTKLLDLESGPTSNYNFSYPALIEHDNKLLVQYWETNYAFGKIALKCASIDTSIL